MFVEQIRDFIKKTEMKLDIAYRKACYEFSKKVCERTGVDTGRLLANYQPGINTPVAYPNIKGWGSSWFKSGNAWIKDISIAIENKNKALSVTLPRIKKVISKLTYKDKYIFVTSEDYARHVEYIGWKRTPPYRMFGRTKVEWDIIVNKVAQEIKNV